MQDKELILIEGDDYVSVEKNKSREKRRILKYAVRLVIILGFVALLVAAIKLFPSIKKHISSKDSSPITNNDIPSNPSENLGNQVVDNIEAVPSGNYQILDTGSKNYRIINESQYEFDPKKEFSASKISDVYKKYGSEAPLVLITCSHIRESFSNGKYYSENDNFYSDKENVGTLAEIIANELNSSGINTIFLNELYASGNIIGSSQEYEKSLKDALKKYPSISYVFNISRGIYINDNLSMEKNTLSDGGAQISLISGTGASMKEQNVLFALDLASYSFEKAPGLVLENKISRFNLSQNNPPFSCEIEIGSFANSFEEASKSAVLFADLFNSYLLSKEVG